MSTVSDIINLYRNGETVVSISRALSIPGLKINRLLRLHGVELRQSPAAKQKRWNRMRELRDQGFPQCKVAALLGVSRQTIRHVMLNNYVVPERSNSRRQDYDEVRRLYKEGMGYGAIAKRLKMSRLTVEYALLENSKGV